MRFRNPLNRYLVTARHPFMWSLVFGVFYFMKHGAWLHVLIGAVLVFVTEGASWFVYPFFAKRIVRNAYLRRGYLQLDTEPQQGH